MPEATISYDTHGNTTTLGNQVMVYDSANRHVKTTVVDAGVTTVITYVGDASGRVVSRSSCSYAALAGANLEVGNGWTNSFREVEE